jgi:competence protein CoiA
MEFSNVNGRRHTAEPGLRGICDLCGGETVSRCGNIRIHHWAHLQRQNCDPWWENETEWHREWKRAFPEHCREVSVVSDDGEKRHRADVKTEVGRVIEFQHSPIKLEERRAREAFYKDMVWVVDGLRRDSFATSFKSQLFKASVRQNSPIKLRVPVGNCSILKTWSDSEVDVYIDFGDTEFIGDGKGGSAWKRRFVFSRPTLWRLSAGIRRRFYVDDRDLHLEIAPVWRDEFIDAALNGGSPDGINDPLMPLTPEPTKAFAPLPEYERLQMSSYPERGAPASRPKRETSESDTDYAVRVWKFDLG